jgi:hypothetical protein
MEDNGSVDQRLRAIASRRALLAFLGVAATTAGAAMLGSAAPALAQETAPKPEVKAPPRRRSISPAPAEPSAPAATGRSRGGKDGDGESVPGGLPGAVPSQDGRNSTPGGLPGAKP